MAHILGAMWLNSCVHSCERSRALSYPGGRTGNGGNECHWGKYSSLEWSSRLRGILGRGIPLWYGLANISAPVYLSSPHSYPILETFWGESSVLCVNILVYSEAAQSVVPNIMHCCINILGRGANTRGSLLKPWMELYVKTKPSIWRLDKVICFKLPNPVKASLFYLNNFLLRYSGRICWHSQRHSSDS